MQSALVLLASVLCACSDGDAAPAGADTSTAADDVLLLGDATTRDDVLEPDITPGPSADIEDDTYDTGEKPETAGPDVEAPDVEEPDTALPDVEAPDTALPDVEEPDTALPDVEAPDTALPDVEEPDAALPDVEEPDTALPDVEDPDTALPDVEAPDTALPDVEDPDVPDVPPPECVLAGDCLGDLSTCTVWECQSGDCVMAYATPGAPCDDGDACTTGDGCEPLGLCAGALLTCDDGDACTTDVCDHALGCAHSAVTCDDGDACTTNGCAKATGCVFTADVCDDGNACTADACDDGLCASTAVFVCSDPLRFRSFAGRAGELSLVGAGAISGAALRLTPAAQNQVGAAWLASKLALSQGFTARFVFDMAVASGSGGDGLAFVLQKVSSTALGSELGTSNGLAVAFDSYQNNGDGSARRMVVRAATATLATVELPGDWTNSGAHAVVVTYAPGRLDVVVDGVTLVNALAVDLALVNNALDADGNAWLGFTSRTGSAFESHDITALFVGPTCPTTACGDGDACTADVCDPSLGCTFTTVCDVDTTTNLAPALTAPQVVLSGAGGPATCTATAADEDQDFVTLSYAWSASGGQSGVSGVIGEGATLAAVPLLVGESVVCTVTVSDGQTTTTASTTATVANSAPISFANAPQLTSSADAEGRWPHAKDTLYCQLTGTYDLDGDDVAIAYSWSVGDNVVLEETRTSGASTLAGLYAKGDWVRCQATPTDGVTAGVTLEASIVIANHMPTCSAQRGEADSRGADESVSCWCEEQPLQDVDGDATETCVWTGVTLGAVITGPCTLTGAQTPDGDILTCTITSSDGESSSSASTTLRIQGGNTGDLTWATPGVTLTPTTLTTGALDEPITCSFNRTAIDSQGGTVTYFIMWQVDSTVGVLYGNEAQVGTTSLRALDAITPGRVVSCVVWPVVANWDFDRQPQSRSNEVQVIDGGPVSNGVLASHSGSVALADAFACTALLHTGTDGDALTAAVQASTDGATWSDVATATTTTSTSMATLVVAEGAGPWLRCRGTVVVNGITTELGTTTAVRAAATPLEVGTALITPAVGEPCELRDLVLGLYDADATAGVATEVLVTVMWSVDGAAAGVDSLALAALEPGWNAVTVPMLGAGAASGQTVTATVTTQKGALAPVTVESAGALVYGAGLQVAQATLPDTARSGDRLECLPGALLGTPCAEPATYGISWYVDAVLSAQTGPEFDTTGLAGGQTVTCAVRAGDAVTGFGQAVLSNGTLLQPGQWTLVGAGQNDFAGVALTVVGDLNDDGYPELAVGAPNATAFGRSSAGKVYLVSGGPSGGTTALADVDAGLAPGAVLYGDSGGWVPNDTICRKKSPSISVPCNPSAAGFNAQGDSEGPLGDGLGTRLVSPGDVTGDGIADLIASAPYAFAHGQYLAGRVYVISGAALAGTTIASVGSVLVGDGVLAGGLSFEGEQGVWQSKLWSLSGAHHEWDGHNAGFGLATGDFDGDGVNDVAIGAPFADPAGSPVNGGKTYVVPLGTGTGGGWLGTLTDATDLTGTGQNHALPGRVLSGKSQLDFLWGEVGSHLSNGGDADGDGKDDLFVGDVAWWSTNYLVPGVASNDESPVDLTGGVGARGIEAATFSFGGIGALDQPLLLSSGKTELFSRGAGVGDVNGDGRGDLAIPYVENENGVGQVELAVFFGAPGGDLDVDGPDGGVGGFVVEGRPGGSDGTDILAPLQAFALGDVDGDGLDDLALSLTRSSGTEAREYRLYVIYGKTDGATLTLADLEAGDGGYVLADLAAAPWSVARGDIDGDGLNDVALGMPSATGDASGAGRVDVWYSRGDRVDLLGLPTDDELTGTTGADHMVGGRGDDALVGLGGADVLYGGAGDDVITVSDEAFVRVAGGLGYDRLVLDNVTLDLANRRGRVEDLEVIELGASSTLSLTATDLLWISRESNTLVVRGSAGSRLNVLDSTFTSGGAAEVDGEPALTLVSGHATLLVVGDVDLRVAPGVTSLAFSVSEDATGTVIGLLTAHDIDGDPVTFSVDLTGVSGVSFQAEPPSLVATEGLDHETAGILKVPVTVTDVDGLSTTATVTVTIEDAPEPPAFSAAVTTATISENPATGRTLATARATDPDVGDVLVYAWVSETHTSTSGASYTDRRAFSVNATSGRITVKDGSYLDYETAEVVELVVSATDSTGLSATVSVVVTLLDYDSLPQTFTLPFLTENRGLWDSDGSLSTDVAGAPLSTIDLTSTLEEGDTAIQSPVSDASYPFTGSVGGTFGGNLEVTASDGYLSAYLPVDITVTLPDDVKLGVPFTIASDWSLNEEAAVWGESPGLSIVFSLFYDAVSAVLDNPLFDTQLNEVMGDIGFDLAFTIEPQAFGGAPFALYYPDGVDLYSPNSTSDGTGYWSWDAAFDLDPAQLQAEGLTESLVLGALLLPPGTKTLGYQNPDLVLSTATSETFLESQLTLAEVATLAGVPYSSFGVWQGDLTMPLLGGAGYATMKYDMWSSRLGTSARYSNLFAVEAESVMGTLTFEDGTTLTRSLRAGFENITLPAGADVNGDGRVTFTLAIAMDAHMYKYWDYNVSLDYLSKTLFAEIKIFMKTLDWSTGEYSGDPKLYDSSSFGPMDTSTYSTDVLHNSGTPNWPLLGFEILTVTGGIQLTK